MRTSDGSTRSGDSRTDASLPYKTSCSLDERTFKARTWFDPATRSEISKDCFRSNLAFRRGCDRIYTLPVISPSPLLLRGMRSVGQTVDRLRPEKLDRGHQGR